ncbi:hypothetical protein G5714_002616 [Onychostoma macrolepis]|uniref:Uncharacterized protein n=1 Tax=Onychostoma macrolepis TaxID=369639 RepID=A0A7J6D798_9TELE|nr:hypothetical protein G5714_002616 [Onychostoma macrolepis]
MATCVEPLDGEVLKFKYPSRYVNKRKFIMSEPIQVLFDFIGQDEMASKVSKVREAASSEDVEHFCWANCRSQHKTILNFEIHCDPVNFTQPSEAPPFDQSSMALPSAQTLVAPPSAQTLVAPPSAQPPVVPPSAQTLVAPFSCIHTYSNFVASLCTEMNQMNDV